MTEEEIDNLLFGIEVNSENRFQAFISNVKLFKEKQYWQALKLAYTCSDNLFQYKGLVKAAFLKDEPFREALMDETELSFIKSLPEEFSLYRGMTKDELKSGNLGVSWTLKEQVAEFFAFTYRRNFDTRGLEKIVYSVSVKKSDIIAVFLDREEEEIIYIHK